MRHVAIRFVQLIVVLLAVTFITTFLMSRFRGDDQAVICSLLGPNCGDPVAAAAITDQLHLDEPVVQRWLLWLGDALHGDLGKSGNSQQPVTTIIGDAAPVTVGLIIYAQVMALAIAIPLGIISAHRQGTRVDRAINTTAFGLLAMPNYVLALVLLLIFAFKLDLFPPVAEDTVGPFDIHQLFLPSLTLALGLVAVYTRLLRTDMIATLQEDFVGMAKAKGMPTRTILLRHALRPSSLNLLTTVGLNFGNLIAGTVVIEVLFGINGIGFALTNAVARRDLFVIQGITALVAVVFVFVNFVIDTMYTMLDPRIRRG